MSDAMQLTGIHHLTAISARPRDNLAFYTGLLGMRLVKKTVNQDDVSAYHLFYADGKANPGTDLTFFDFPAAPERRGANSISRTSLRVAGEKSLAYWSDRLKQAGGHTGDVTQVDGRLTLPFEDGKVSVWCWSMTAAPVQPRHGQRARCRRSIRSAASVRSCSTCMISSVPNRS